MLIAQAAHEPPAGAGDLRRVERREMLILGDTRLHRDQLRQPAGAAELAATAADAVHALGFIAHADVPHMHARTKRAFELPDELPEVHALLRREEHGEAFFVQLPLGIGNLQVEPERADLLDGAHPHVVLVRTLLRGARDLVAVRGAHRLTQGIGARLAMRRAGFALEGEVPGGMDMTEILAAFDFHDNGRRYGGSVFKRPVEELAPISLE